MEESWKNHGRILIFDCKNPDFLLSNPEFRLKNVDFIIKQVFLINISDSAGYLGTISLLLFKNYRSLQSYRSSIGPDGEGTGTGGGGETGTVVASDLSYRGIQFCI